MKRRNKVSNIRINPGKLDTASSRLKRLAQDMAKEGTEVASAKNGIEESWSSDCRDILLDDLQITQTNITKLTKATETLAASLKKIAEEARKIERQNASGFGGGGGGSW